MRPDLVLSEEEIKERFKYSRMFDHCSSAIQGVSADTDSDASRSENSKFNLVSMM